jgi:hypothetical protein
MELGRKCSGEKRCGWQLNTGNEYCIWKLRTESNNIMNGRNMRFGSSAKKIKEGLKSLGLPYIWYIQQEWDSTRLRGIIRES